MSRDDIIEHEILKANANRHYGEVIGIEKALCAIGFVKKI